MPQHDEWGPWIEHDGRGCPVPDGTMCHRVFDRPACGNDARARGHMEDISRVEAVWEARAWKWNNDDVRIIRYRIRKPRGLTILQELIENLPTPTEREKA